jgi:hypothetical protein
MDGLSAGMLNCPTREPGLPNSEHVRSAGGFGLSFATLGGNLPSKAERVKHDKRDATTPDLKMIHPR